jgi:hypothetical protein
MNNSKIFGFFLRKAEPQTFFFMFGRFLGAGKYDLPDFFSRRIDIKPPKIGFSQIMQKYKSGGKRRQAAAS